MMKKMILLPVIVLWTSGCLYAQWQEKNMGVDVLNIQFVDNDYGWLHTWYNPAWSFRDAVSRTTDGGMNWDSQWEGLHRFRFVDRDHGWGYHIMENTNYVSIWHTTDGGYNWVLQKDSLPPIFDADFFFTDELNGWFYQTNNYFWNGDTTFIYHTVDAGEHWDLITKVRGATKDIYFTDSLTGFLVGQNLLDIPGVLLGYPVVRTTDGGQTWTGVPIYSGQYTNWVSSITFSDPMNGWITNIGMGVDPSIYHTIDGGISWYPQLVDSLPELKDIAFPDILNGWAVGKEGTVLHTSDGGTTWELQDAGVVFNLTTVCFTDQYHGWISGDNSQSYLYTDNGGVTGIRENTADGIVLYPNPARSIVTITTKHKILNIEILNMKGQLIVHRQKQNPVDISGIPPGVYLMRIVTEEGITMKKFQKYQ